MTAFFAAVDRLPDSVVLVIVGVLFLALCALSNRRRSSLN
jgi:hypothetical protein